MIAFTFNCESNKTKHVLFWLFTCISNIIYLHVCKCFNIPCISKGDIRCADTKFNTHAMESKTFMLTLTLSCHLLVHEIEFFTKSDKTFTIITSNLTVKCNPLWSVCLSTCLSVVLSIYLSRRQSICYIDTKFNTYADNITTFNISYSFLTLT